MIIENWSLRGVLYTQYQGVVTGEQLINYALGASGDERFENLHFVIGDWTGIEQTKISAEDVRELMACLKVMARLCPYAQNASIVNRTESGLALAAWYQHLAEGLSWEVSIFHNLRSCFEQYQLDFTQVDPHQDLAYKNARAS
ncbi:hypothetical protein [Agaribacterium sp. ZY112]|uniref:hypothetical protein n=1 Tax=Agaribacterium sp. ZY112 TaxID=3233574 RepID=UPI0035260700